MATPEKWSLNPVTICIVLVLDSMLIIFFTNAFYPISQSVQIVTGRDRTRLIDPLNKISFSKLKLTDFDNDIYTTHHLINDNTLYYLWFEIASSSRNGTSRNDRNGVCVSLRGCPQTAAAISTAESVSLSNSHEIH